MDFLYTVDPYAAKPIMLLNDDIGFDPTTGRGIDGAKFQAELMALDAMQPESIEVWINSPGGVVMDGYNIYSAILKTKTKVDTVGVGCMASIAAVIFQAGRTRTMMDYSWLMYHDPFGGDDKKTIEIMKDSIAKMVARSGKPQDEILTMMKKETYITAQEALEYGLCDKIEATTDYNKKRLPAPSDVANFKLEANKILNTLITPKQTKMSFKLVTNKLGLNADATEDNILAAITEMENRASKAEKALQDKIADLEKKMKADKSEYDSMTSQLADMKKERDAAKKAKDDQDEELMNLKKEKEEAEDKMLTEKCQNKLKEYAKMGKIKDDEKTFNFWTPLMKAAFEATIEQLDELPVSKKAPVIQVENKGDKPKYSMGIAMAEIAANYNKRNNIN